MDDLLLEVVFTQRNELLSSNTGLRVAILQKDAKIEELEKQIKKLRKRKK